MNNEMIIAEAGIDSLGYFSFALDYLPQGENLYRLHLVKKGDTRATLIIGGKDENHLFFIINHPAKINFKSVSVYPPFKNVEFYNSPTNTAFQQISSLLFTTDSIASQSPALKRKLLEQQLLNSLLQIADTSNNLLIGLYAIYKSKFETNFLDNEALYTSYYKKWRHVKSDYFQSFVRQVPISKSVNFWVVFMVAALVLSAIAFVAGKYGFFSKQKIKKLSIQERRVYELLLEGNTNQEIADTLHIGLSTVKSHATSIYTKFKVKSRKELMDK